MKIKECLSLLCLAFCGACFAQQALTNDSVLKMVKAGLSEDVIVSTIQRQPGDYTVTPDAVAALKQAGVTGKELAAMVTKGTTIAATAPETSEYDDLETGVYDKVDGRWMMVPSEQVDWKTGGILKNIASEGIVHEDVNGRLRGPASATRLTGPLTFLIKTPDGIDATDFTLIHLHEKRNSREFRTVTGGVFHSTGGSSRDEVQFKQKKVSRYTYEVMLPPGLPTGEYAFLAPGLTASSANGSIGKAYTFHLAE
ncbi:MAG TPA: hypothetical protein VFW25_13180 [Silvibacterium sp.]|nr:hypothetical protein [Silvibacterium sp.]